MRVPEYSRSSGASVFLVILPGIFYPWFTVSSWFLLSKFGEHLVRMVRALIPISLVSIKSETRVRESSEVFGFSSDVGVIVTNGNLTDRMWFSVVYSFIDSNTRHHSGQNVVDS